MNPEDAYSYSTEDVDPPVAQPEDGRVSRLKVTDKVITAVERGKPKPAEEGEK